MIFGKVGLLLRESFESRGWKCLRLGMETCVAAGASFPGRWPWSWHHWVPSLSAKGASKGFHPHHRSFLLCFCLVLFILAALGFPSLNRLFSSCAEQEPSSCCAWAACGSGVSCRGAQAPGCSGTRSCSFPGSAAVVHRLHGCSACGALPLSRQGSPRPGSHCTPFLSSLSASTLSVSSGSSLGSPASSRGSLNTSSRGPTPSAPASSTTPAQGDQLDVGLSVQTGLPPAGQCGYMPSGPITTIHEHAGGQVPQPAWPERPRAAAAAPGHPTPGRGPQVRNVPVLRGPPCLPCPRRLPLLVLEGAFPMSPHDGPSTSSLLTLRTVSWAATLADISLREHQLLLDPDPEERPVSAGREQGAWRVCSGATVRGARRHTETTL